MSLSRKDSQPLSPESQEGNLEDLELETYESEHISFAKRTRPPRNNVMSSMNLRASQMNPKHINKMLASHVSLPSARSRSNLSRAMTPMGREGSHGS